jgi:osmoprotectant transport system permease protein
MGGDYEIFQRQEWRSLERHYGLAFAEQRSMDPSLMYQAIQAGEVGVISAYSTDGRVASYGLVALEDDRGAIPPYDAVILVSGRLAREQPRAVAALRALAGKIDAPRMQRMNAAVDEGKASPAQVARRFLEEMAR